MVSKYKRLSLSILIAFVLVAIVFIFGYFYDSSKIAFLNANLQNYEQNINQLELATLLPDSNSTFSCNVLSNNLYSIASEMQQLSNQLTSSSLKTSEMSYSQLNDAYTYARVEYWLLSNKINSMCGNKLATIMFIYPQNAGTNSIVEGNELSFLSSENSSLVVSAMDGNLNLSIVKIILQSYNISISSLPTIILDNKYVKSGYLNTSAIKSLICKYGTCINFTS